MAGIITATSISGSLDAKNIVLGVLEQASAMSRISSIFTVAPVPELTATIPIVKPGAVDEDVSELETSDIETGTFLNVDFSLKKDRVKLAASDESKYKSRGGDPLSLQVRAAGNELARILDKKVITAIQTTPQTSNGAAWGGAVSPLPDIAAAVAAIHPYRADFCVMPAAVYSKYAGSTAIANFGTGNPAEYRGAIAVVPGFDIPIYIDTNCTANTCTIGSAQGLGAVIGQGPVEVHEEYSMDLGARIYQMDVFRQVVAPVFKTSAATNAAVYQITGLDA